MIIDKTWTGSAENQAGQATLEVTGREPLTIELPSFAVFCGLSDLLDATYDLGAKNALDDVEREMKDALRHARNGGRV